MEIIGIHFLITCRRDAAKENNMKNADTNQITADLVKSLEDVLWLARRMSEGDSSRLEEYGVVKAARKAISIAKGKGAE